MDLIAKIYDSDGQEIDLKPDHVLVMGKEGFCQMPIYEKDSTIDSYEAKFIYKPLQEEWGSLTPVRFRTHDGKFMLWGDEEFVKSIEEHNEENT